MSPAPTQVGARRVLCEPEVQAALPAESASCPPAFVQTADPSAASAAGSTHGSWPVGSDLAAPPPWSRFAPAGLPRRRAANSDRTLPASCTPLWQCGAHSHRACGYEINAFETFTLLSQVGRRIV